MKIQRDDKPHFAAFGTAMLEKMGWKEGDGLGKDRQGRSEAITVKKKEDTVGVGGDPSYAWGEKWWEAVYDSSSKLDALAALQESDSSDSSDSSDEDNEDSKLSRKNKPKKAKTKKQADGSSSDDDKDDDEAVEVGRDGILCTATKEELAIAKELAADPWGRWGGKNGKMARIRAAEASFHAAGSSASTPPGPSTTTATTATPVGGKVVRQKTTKSSGKGSAGNLSELGLPRAASHQEMAIEPVKGMVCWAALNAQEQRASQGKGLGSSSSGAFEGGVQRTRSGLSIGAPSGSTNGDGAGTRDWWGASMFVAAGTLGSQLDEREALSEALSKARAASKGEGFTEQDQEHLYTRTQEGKTTGRKGLGKRSGAVLGNAYTGNRVILAPDSDEEIKAEGSDDDLARVRLTKGSTQASDLSLEDSVKWKKHIKKALEDAPKRKMKLKKLQKVILALAATKLGEKASTQALVDVFMKKVQSSMFNVSEGVVSLAQECKSEGAESNLRQTEDGPAKKKSKTRSN